MKTKKITKLLVTLCLLFSVSLATHAVLTTTASSFWVAGMEASAARDGNVDTYWSSNWPGGETNRQEWIGFNFGETLPLSKITLTPRASGTGFPVDFEIQTSTDGTNWTAIPGQIYTNYVKPGNANPIDFTFSSPLTTQYIRVFATKLADIGGGFFMFGLTEIDYSIITASTIASSFWVAGMEASAARDGNVDTYWSSNWPGGETNRQEWIGFNFGETRPLSKITLTPRASGVCFPVDFEIQTSTNGINWTAVPGHTYTSYVNPGNMNPIDFTFLGGLTTQYIRVYATKLADIGGGFFMFALTQIDYTTSLSTSIENVDLNKVNVYQSGYNIIVDMERLSGLQNVSLISVTGQIINTWQFSGGTKYALNSIIKPGIYIVKIESGSKTYSSKIFVM